MPKRARQTRNPGGVGRRWPRLLAAATVTLTIFTYGPTAASAAPVAGHPAPQPRSTASARQPGAASTDAAAVIAARRGISRAAAARLLRDEHAQAAVAERMTSTLGDARIGGAYLDDGALVVAVTDVAAAATATTAGAKARVVARSQRQLKEVQSALAKVPSPTGTTWGIDAEANQVVVTLPAGEAAAGQQAAAGRYRDAVRVETADGTVTPTAGDVAGGDAIFGTGGCSAGFTVTDGAFNYVLTAGHCTVDFPRWRIANGTDLGPTVQSDFPGTDYGLVLIQGPVTPIGGVYLWDGSTIQNLTGSSTAVAGLDLCKSGRTTGLTCGTVRKTGVTVNGTGGTVQNMIETNICLELGDSGGSLFASSIAYGLSSMSSLDSAKHCLTGSSTRSWYQPVGPALAAYQVNIIG
jgi:streptogrisin D